MVNMDSTKIPKQPHTGVKQKLRQPFQKVDNIINQMDQTPLGRKRKALRYDKRDSPDKQTASKRQNNQKNLSQVNHVKQFNTIVKTKQNGITNRSNIVQQKDPVKTTQISDEYTNFQQLRDQTGQSIIDILDKRITFQKKDVAEKKFKLLQQHLKDLRLVGEHLQQSNLEQDQQIGDLHQTVQNLKIESSQSEQLYQQIQQQKEQVLREKGLQIQSYIKQLKDVEAYQQLLKSDSIQQQQQITALGTLVQHKEELIGNLQLKSQDLNFKNEKAQQMLQISNESQDQVNKHSQNLQQYNQQLKNDLDQIKFEMTQIKEEKSTIAQEKNAIYEQFQGLKTESKFKFKELEELRQKNDINSQLYMEFQAKSNQLNQDCQKSKQERDDLNAQLIALRQEKLNLELSTSKRIEQLQSITKSQDNLMVHCDNQQDVVDNMRREVRIAQSQAETTDQLSKQRRNEIDQLKAEQDNLQNKLKVAEDKIEEQDVMRRKLHNIIQELKGNVRVFARVRPLIGNEAEQQVQNGLQLFQYPSIGETSDQGLEVNTPQNYSIQQQQGRGNTLPNRYQFQFDKVFTPKAQQVEIFDEISQLVQSALDGYKVCIFAYGQTGSGKTYTMMGQEDQLGIIPRAIEQIFQTSQKMKSQGWVFQMKAYMLEIYNEEIQDLLAKGDSNKKHQILHDPSGTSVTDIQLFDVNSPEKLTHLLNKAMQKRAVGATAINQRSSRSHMVFALKIDGRNNSTDQNVHGVLNLIDLAGSERLKESQATGLRMKEAQFINKSLSSLGDVISALASKNDHIPFRNSKLTYLLQQCLGGDAKTLMFVNVSSHIDSVNESLNSLRFATKVNNCEIGTAKRNTK